jgi:hypothetical protein
MTSDELCCVVVVGGEEEFAFTGVCADCWQGG